MKKLVRGLSTGAAMAMISLAVIFGAIGTVPKANAEDGQNSGSGSTTTTKEVETEHATEVENHSTSTEIHRTSDSSTAKAQAETAAKERRQAEEKTLKERREAAKEKLSAAKLKVCNNRKENIDKHVSQISERATKHLAVFNSISERVQAFYTTKGNTLANYDALVADVQAKKATASSTVDALVAQKSSVDCESNAPKAAITTYKTALDEARAALKEYRLSIKNLIVGVKSVNAAGTDDSAKSSEETR
jgi:hypothetical protein